MEWVHMCFRCRLPILYVLRASMDPVLVHCDNCNRDYHTTAPSYGSVFFAVLAALIDAGGPIQQFCYNLEGAEVKV